MSQNSFLGTDSLPAIVPTSDEKTLGLLAHVLTFVASFLAPLIIYLIKKDQSEFVADHAKESLNFQITLFLAVMVCIPLSIILIGIPVLILIGVLSLVWRIVATIKASEGKIYRYPYCLRLIK
ncbi:DUF4870 domain-containing protein [Panacibacter ginsenosidivorans]|uniref:DUF4870 domain-containing protein n=1 Tax=Panacibacter ginsenosidivorans TaxID=1813871 RepID=A0A5B8V9A3_9BACT|nr:DUF4870 domain-containing protein [Panacibacter ginsenosidivorans]QEC68057.1 DUF4870 domain-containing protein [Panacibacter ginsenosidivorans]